MAEVTDDFGRVSNFDKADIESIASMLKSAVGKAVDYAAGKAKSAGDETEKSLKELVKAMEDLGVDIKDSLKSTRDFVEEVKRAAETIGKKRESKAVAGKDSLADAQREQTRILNMILKSQQKAMSDKAAKFTSGGTALASKTPKRSGLKDMGFRPRGTDKIPAMLSPGEFIVNNRGTKNNEPFLNMINRGYRMGGKVRPEYLSGGSNLGSFFDLLKGRKAQVFAESEAKVRVLLDMGFDPNIEREVKEHFAREGKVAAVEFSKEYSRNLRQTLSTWLVGITNDIVGGNPWAQIFRGGVKDATEFRVEMRKLAFEAEGITGNFREAQAAFADIGKGISARTGKGVEALQKAYLENARRGFKDQKAAMKTLQSGLKLSTLIGSETQETANLFADWQISLNLSAGQMERMANNMQMVARTTGVTGKELIAVMRSSEGILKNLRKQGTLTTTASRNIIQAMAEFKKQGFEDTGQRMLSAMSGYSAFQAADEGMRRLLHISADRGGVNQMDLMQGRVPQDADSMGKMGTGLNKWLAELIDVDPQNFDIDMITKSQRETLSIALDKFGIQLGDAEAAINTYKKAQMGLAGTLDELNKKRLSKNATDKEKQEAEKKMSDTLRSASMDMLQSVSGVAEKFGDKSLDEIAKLLQGDNKFAEEFRIGTKDLATISGYMSDSTKSLFGLSGDQKQMEAQIASMGVAKQMQLRSIAAAEQLDKSMVAQGKSSQDFGERMRDAMAKGDTARFKALAEEMTEANSKMQVEDATGVDPMVQLEQTTNKLNETMRAYLSKFVGGIIDLLGSMGLLAVQFGMMATSLYSRVGKDFIGAISELAPGEKLMKFFGKPSEMVSMFKSQFNIAKFTGASSIDAIGTSLGKTMSSFFPAFQKALGPAVLLLGGIKGAMESESVGLTKTEGAILGMLTGGADTGSFLSPMLGVQKDSALDKTLGVAGAAAWGASAGAAISLSLGGADFGASIILGAIFGAFAEIIKIITKGTDILTDLLSPFQAIGDWLSGVFGDLWNIIKSFATLNPVTIIGSIISGVFGIITKTIYGFFSLIFGLIRATIIGLPKLILKVLMMIWDIPKAIMDSIKRSLSDLANNKWFGPIFKTLSVAFNAIYDGFMAVWTPIAEIFSGLYRVFDDLGKALFGAGKGGGFLGAIMWGLQKAVWAVSYVISWLLSPIILLAKALGFVLKIVGTMIKAIIYPFQWMYDVLVGHSIVPDLITGIVGWFAKLPIYIFKALTFVPRMIFRAFKRMPANIFSGMKLIVNELPRFLLSILMNGLSYMGNFFMFTLPNVLWTSFTGALKKVGKYIYDAITYPFRKVRDFLYSIFIGFPKWLFGKFVGIFTDSGTYIKAALVGIVTWFGSGLIGSLGGFISTVAGFFGGLPSLISGGFTSALSGVWNWISGWVPSLGGVGGAVSKAGGAALDFGKSLIPSIKDKASKAFEKLGGVSGVIKSHAIDYFKKGKGLISSMVSKGAGLFGKANTGTIKGMFSKAMSMGAGLFGKAGPATKGFFSKAMNLGAGLFGKAGPATKGFFSKAMSMGSGLLGKVSGGGKGLFAKAMSMGSGLLGKVSGGGKGLFAKAMSMGSGLLGRFGGAGKGIMGKAKGLFDKLGGGKGLMGKAKSLLSGDFGGLMDSLTGGGEGEDAGCGCALASTAAESATEQASLMEGVQEMLTPENLQKGFGFAKDFMSKGKDMLGGLFGKGKGLFGDLAGKVGGMFSKGGGILSGLFGGGGISKAASGLMSKGAGLVGSLFGGGGGASKAAGGLVSKGAGLVGSLFGGGGIGKLASGLMGGGGGGGIVGSLFGKAGGFLAKAGLGGVGKSLLKKIPGVGAIAGAGFAIADLVKGNIGGALTNLASGLAGAIPVIGPVLSTGIDMFGGTIAKGAGWLASKAWGGAKKLGSAVGDLASKAWDGAKKLGSSVGRLVSNAWKGAKGLGGLAWKGAKTMAKYSPIGMAFRAFKSGGGLLGGLFGKGANLGAKVLSSIKGGAGIMGSMFGRVGNFIAKAGLGGVGRSLIKRIPGIGAIAGAGMAVADLMKGNFGGALKNMASGLASSVPLIGPMLSMGIDVFGDKLGKGSSFIWKGIKGFGEKINEGSGLVKSWWDSWWGGGKDATATAAAGTPKAEAKPAGATEPQTAQPATGSDPSGSIKRERAGSTTSKFQSDELARIEDSSLKQIGELEQIRQGIQELVILLKPKGGGVAGDSSAMGPASTRDPRRPMHAARFGKMKYGKIGGNANRSYVNNGEA